MYIMNSVSKIPIRFHRTKKKLYVNTTLKYNPRNNQLFSLKHTKKKDIKSKIIYRIDGKK